MLNTNNTATKCKLFAILFLASMPLIAGCDPITLAGGTFGAVFWLDLALTPVRSFLGGTALDIVNTF